MTGKAFFAILILIFLFNSRSEATQTCSSDKRLHEIEQEVLHEHNKFRKLHGVPELDTSTILRKIAQEWAELCLRENIFIRRPNNPYGENAQRVVMSMGLNYSPRTIINLWYSSGLGYNYSTQEMTNKSKYFAQVVWKETLQIGVGYAFKNNHSDSTHVLFVYYDPQGLDGEPKENVLPPIDSST